MRNCDTTEFHSPSRCWVLLLVAGALVLPGGALVISSDRIASAQLVREAEEAEQPGSDTEKQHAERVKPQERNAVGITVQLRDDSRLHGTIHPGTAVLTTKAVSEVPFHVKDIKNIVFSDDRETALVTFHNGDSLTGVLDLYAIELEMLFGKVSVSIEHIQQISTNTARDNGIIYDAALATLPSEQRFTLFSNHPGHAAYKIVSDVLHQGPTELSGEQWWFCNTTPLDFSTNGTGVAVEWIVRVKSSGSHGSLPKIDSRGGWGVSVADRAGRWFIIHHREDAVFIQNQDAERGFSDVVWLDTTENFHRYRFVASKGTGKLFIDGSKHAAVTIGLGPTTSSVLGGIDDLITDIQVSDEPERGQAGRAIEETRQFHEDCALKTGLVRGPNSHLIRNRNIARFGDLTDYAGSETLLKCFFIGATSDSTPPAIGSFAEIVD